MAQIDREEFIKEFLKVSDAIDGIKETSDSHLLAIRSLMQEKYLSDISVINVWKILQRGNRDIDAGFDFLRKRDHQEYGIQGIHHSLVSSFLSGWLLWMPDRTISTEELLKTHREFMLAQPFPFDNGRIGRILLLWAMLRNKKVWFTFKTRKLYEQYLHGDFTIKKNTLNYYK